MNAKKQDGKGLSGFILGLLLATLVIAGVLFFLNQSNKRVFKEEVQKELPPPPEVLIPSGSSAASEGPLPASGEYGASSDVLGDFIEEQQASEITGGNLPAVVPPRAERPTKPAAKPAEKKTAPKPAAKPTPEQILESGNIEKARKEAQAEKARKQTESKTASSGGHAIVQMGSFGDRQSAEAHRAKLAMMGVSSNVAEATVNGQSVYRVESGRLSKADAEQTRKTLQENNVNSFTRSVK